MRPVVSVVIAAYNGESFIEETCRSVMAQTFTAFEVVVVDDGSTDRTAEIVRSLAAEDPRIRCIPQKNLGVAAARNRGIAEAVGEFVAPLDADDLWNPQKLERQVERMHASGPQTGMVYCWWAWIDEQSRVLDRSPRWQIEGHVLDHLAEVNFSGPTSVPLYRRSCLVELGGYNEGFRQDGNQGCEDWDLAVRVAERYSVAVVPAVLVGYRRLSESMSSNCEAMWRSQRQMMDTLAARQPGMSRAVIRRSNAQFALHLAGVAFWSRRYMEACRWALRARALPLLVGIMPHVTRLLLLRVFGQRLRERPRFDGDGALDDSRLPEPLIPYDRICARRWDGRTSALPPGQ